MESFSIEVIEVIVHKCSTNGVFEIFEELIRKHSQRKTTSDNRCVIWLLCPQALKPKNALENCAFDVLDVHKYPLCMSI